jgi:O-glycosyl hydrolase
LFINVNYVGFHRQITDGGAYHHNDPAEYAEFVLATHLHLRDEYGIVPDAWEVILEPDNTDMWRGRQIGEAIIASAERLQSHGFTTPFIAPSNSNMGRAIDYFDDMIEVPGVRERLAEFSYHRYGGVSNANLQAIADRTTQNGVRSSMLEHIGSGHEDLHEDLTLGMVSAWQQFALAFQQTRPLKDGGAVYYRVDVTDPASPEVVIGSRTRYLSQYFRYVRRGATRIMAASKDNTFDPIAFVNPDGGYVVVIKADSGGELTIGGLPAGAYGVNYTTAEEFNIDGAERSVGADGVLAVGIPDSGVLSIYRQ